MPDPSAINTWPAVAAFALALLALQIPGLVATFRTRRDTRVIRKQTENEHQDAEHPNLREQLDAMHADIRGMKTELGTVKTDLADHVQQADSWQAAVEDDLSRLRRPILSWRR